MKFIDQKQLLTTLILFLLMGIFDFWLIEAHGASLSERGVIDAVKAKLEMESQPKIVWRQRLVTTMCSPQRAARDPRCQPCAPGSPNFCIREWRTKPEELPGRCRFPPSNNAKWSATYNAYTKKWEVISFDPMVTGRNYWIVDDRSRVVLSGYCVFD